MSKNDAHEAKRATRVLIVDDHPVVREGLALRISRQPDLQVCGEAADIAEAMRAVEATNPDVAIVDIALRTGNGIDLIKRLKTRHESVRILVWSMYNESLYAERAMRAGAIVAGLAFAGQGYAAGRLAPGTYVTPSGSPYRQ